MKLKDCCDGPGGVKTYRNQAVLPINGRVRCIDWCIHHIVASLNASGLETIASCCGHDMGPGRIDLEDGRVLVVTDDPEVLERLGIDAPVDTDPVHGMAARRKRAAVAAEA